MRRDMAPPARLPKGFGAAARAACAGVLGAALASCSSEPGTTASIPAEARAATAPAGDGAPGRDAPPPAASPLAALDSQGEQVPVEERSKPQGFVSEAGTAARSAPQTAPPSAPPAASPATPRDAPPAPRAPRALSPATVPLAPMGAEPGASVLDGVESPDRVRDDEADAVRRGKRVVGPISNELSGGFASAEDLARAILKSTRANDTQGLHALRVSDREFAAIFWPEFPQSRPATNVQAEDAWFFHDASCHDGVNETISEFGGRDLELIEVRSTRGRLDYTNFDLYDGIVIDAVDSSGERVSIPWALTFAERRGTWKVFLYRS